MGPKTVEVSEIRLIISGHVQGVALRRTITAWAQELAICGFVRNQEDGTVYVCAQGERPHLETLQARCYIGNEQARVSDVRAEWCKPAEHYSSFTIK